MSKASNGIRNALEQAVRYTKGTAGFPLRGGGRSRVDDVEAIRTRLIALRIDAADTVSEPSSRNPPLSRDQPAPLLGDTKLFENLDSPTAASLASPTLDQRLFHGLLSKARRLSRALLALSGLVFEWLPSLARRFARPIRLGGILVVMAAILVTGVWALRSNWTLPSLFTSRASSNPANLRTWPEQAPPLPSSSSGVVPPTQTRDQTRPTPQRTRTAPSSAIAVAPRDRGARVEIESPQVAATIVAPGMPAAAKPGKADANPPPGIVPPLLHGEASADVAHAAPARIYSASDVDVTPLEHSGSGRANAQSPGDGSNAGEMVEIVVNEQGAVEFVKATIPPRTIAESMLLTAGLHIIKSWQFRPALRDGSPVRYRQLMSVELLDIGLPLRR